MRMRRAMLQKRRLLRMMKKMPLTVIIKKLKKNTEKEILVDNCQIQRLWMQILNWITRSEK